MWYNAVVERVLPKTVWVMFTDYGNSDEVEKAFVLTNTASLPMGSVPKYLRISRKHAHAEFFHQTTPHYLRKGPHNSAKVTEIIDTSANKGEDGLKMMAELASQRVVLLGPKHNHLVSGVSEL